MKEEQLPFWLVLVLGPKIHDAANNLSYCTATYKGTLIHTCVFANKRRQQTTTRRTNRWKSNNSSSTVKEGEGEEEEEEEGDEEGEEDEGEGEEAGTLHLDWCRPRAQRSAFVTLRGCSSDQACLKQCGQRRSACWKASRRKLLNGNRLKRNAALRPSTARSNSLVRDASQMTQNKTSDEVEAK